MWLEALLSSIEGGLKKKTPLACRADCSRQGEARLHTLGLWWSRAKGSTASLCADLGEGQLACAVPKPGRMGSKSYDNWLSPRQELYDNSELYIRALPSRMRAGLNIKDSWSAPRADPSRQCQARLHTVGFGLAEGRRPDGQPMCGVGQRPDCVRCTQAREDGLRELG